MAAMTMAAKVAYGILGLTGAAVVGSATGVIPVQDWVERITVQEQAPAELLATPPEDDTPAPEAEVETALVVPDSPVSDEETPAAAPDADVVVPSFDLLRVEPDGSVVIAGNAVPNAQVEAFAGTRSLGSAEAEANGDFVIVFDDPLEPGDYEIVLRADAADGTSATSTETAVVSVPERGEDGVLALVEEPGEPSRLITTGEGAAEPLVPVVPDQDVAVVKEPEPEPVEPEVAAVEATEEPVTVEPAQTDPEIAETEGETEPVEAEAVAAVEPEATEVAPAQTADVRIEAVEIDGETLFVAGAATPGSRLNVYANDILLGTTTASPGGRFLVEVNRDLPVGDYMIRADVLAANGSDVLVRVAVPFQRQPGERLAAVAVVEPARLPQSPPVIAGEEPESVIVPQTLGELSGAPVIQQPATPEVAMVEPATAPALTPVDRSVIIRRGDTLWQISRRVYGRGIRYTTIYLANTDQIRDPDRIWPGQVFALPEDSEDEEPGDQ